MSNRLFVVFLIIIALLVPAVVLGADSQGSNQTETQSELEILAVDVEDQLLLNERNTTYTLDPENETDQLFRDDTTGWNPDFSDDPKASIVTISSWNFSHYGYNLMIYSYEENSITTYPLPEGGEYPAHINGTVVVPGYFPHNQAHIFNVSSESFARPDDKSLAVGASDYRGRPQETRNFYIHKNNYAPIVTAKPGVDPTDHPNMAESTGGDITIVAPLLYEVGSAKLDQSSRTAIETDSTSDTMYFYHEVDDRPDKLIAYNVSTGTTVWEHSADNDGDWAKLRLDDDKLFVFRGVAVDSGSPLAIVNKTTGKRISTDKYGRIEGDEFEGSPYVGDDFIVSGESDDDWQLIRYYNRTDGSYTQLEYRDAADLRNEQWHSKSEDYKQQVFAWSVDRDDELLYMKNGTEITVIDMAEDETVGTVELQHPHEDVELDTVHSLTEFGNGFQMWTSSPPEWPSDSYREHPESIVTYPNMSDSVTVESSFEGEDLSLDIDTISGERATGAVTVNGVETEFDTSQNVTMDATELGLQDYEERTDESWFQSEETVTLTIEMDGYSYRTELTLWYQVRNDTSQSNENSESESTGSVDNSAVTWIAFGLAVVGVFLTIFRLR
jgi:hypothetical protein